MGETAKNMAHIAYKTTNAVKYDTLRFSKLKIIHCIQNLKINRVKNHEHTYF